MRAPNQAESFPGRTFYRGRGVDWGRFLPFLALALIVAILLAEGMAQLFMLGHYYIFFVPAIAALGVGGMMFLAVNKGHCRNTIVAGAAGIVAGVVLYLGQYYSGMIHDFGPDVAAHPELLPKYIRLRMAVEVTRDIHENDDQPKKVTKADSYMNWFRFIFECTLVVAITTGISLKRARKPYCDACRRWMVREVTQFDPNKSEELLGALRNSSAHSLAAMCAQPVFATVPNLSLAVEYCPSLKEEKSRDCPIYASVKQIASAVGTMKDSFDTSKGKLLLRSVQLVPNEIAALGSRFKILETFAGRAAVAAFKPEASQETFVDAASMIDVKPIEPEYAGKVLTSRTAWIGTAYAFLGLLIIFGGICLAAWGGMTAFPDKNKPQDVPPVKKVLGITVMSVGGLLFAGSAIFFLVNPTYFSNRYMLKRIREEFARRPKCLVDANDPDATFIEIVPKLNWGKTMLITASDVGFLKVDRSRKEILFEGDKQRFRIPAAAITNCSVEYFVEGQGTHAARKIYYVVLRARHPNEFWEAPICGRGSSGLFRTGRRKKSANLLCASIDEIRGVDKSSKPVLA